MPAPIPWQRGSATKRPALVTMKQGRAEPQPADGGWDEELSMPVVNPAEILTLDTKPSDYLLTTDRMVMTSQRSVVTKRWAKLYEELSGDREGTVYDPTADIIAYEDQESLKEVRMGYLEVMVDHLMAAINGTGTWPTVLAVESWLRDAVMMSERVTEKKASVQLWVIVVAEVAGAEAIREVIHCMGRFSMFRMEREACSGKSTHMYARAATKRALAIGELLWADVMLAVESVSADVFWDWRRADVGCFVHGSMNCSREPYPRRYPKFMGGCVRCGLPSEDEENAEGVEAEGVDIEEYVYL